MYFFFFKKKRKEKGPHMKTLLYTIASKYLHHLMSFTVKTALSTKMRTQTKLNQTLRIISTARSSFKKTEMIVQCNKIINYMLCGPYSWNEIPVEADTSRTGAPKKERLQMISVKLS